MVIYFPRIDVNEQSIRKCTWVHTYTCTLERVKVRELILLHNLPLQSNPIFPDVQFPLWERRKLPLLMRAPQQNNTQKPRKMPKRLIDMRGPELVHNQLIHKQFGIQVFRHLLLCTCLAYYITIWA